jgi:tetratricopeptide (TPR) repeat protein
MEGDPVITINRKRVETQLQKQRQNLEMNPDLWLFLEGVGRCLAYLGDPQATDYFQQAALKYALIPGDPIQLANLYRLAGNMAQARQHYQQMHDLLMPFDFTNNENDVKLDRLALCTYMLGDDPLTITAVEHRRSMQRKGDEWLNTFSLADLAAARRQQDVAQAQAAHMTIEAIIRRSRAQPWSTGYFTRWDTYAEARRVVRELGGDPDAPQEAA